MSFSGSTWKENTSNETLNDYIHNKDNYRRLRLKPRYMKTHQDFTNQTMKFSFTSPSLPLSKFSWDNRYIPRASLRKIIPQLKDGNEFTIEYDEWLTGTFIDIMVYAGCYLDHANQTKFKIKLTNTDRRKILSMI